MNNEELSNLSAAATSLFENIKADIKNASTRAEHIRLTALAQEAAHLVTRIHSLDGTFRDVYTETTHEIISKEEDGTQP
jgi:hypothetical protein